MTVEYVIVLEKSKDFVKYSNRLLSYNSGQSKIYGSG